MSTIEFNGTMAGRVQNPDCKSAMEWIDCQIKSIVLDFNTHYFVVNDANEMYWELAPMIGHSNKFIMSFDHGSYNELAMCLGDAIIRRG
jgi:hypothetical protein